MKVINKGTRTWIFPTQLYLVPNKEMEVPEELEEAVLSLPEIEIIKEKRNKREENVMEVMEDVRPLSD